MQIEYRGTLWEIDENQISRTSDGFFIGTGFALDEDGERLEDEDGFPVIHSFFLGGSN